QRIAEDVTMREGPLDPWGCTDVVQAPLQAKNLTKTFDIASSQREMAEPGPRRFSVVAMRSVHRQPKRHEQTAEQDGIGQRFRRRVETAAIAVELGEGAPQRLAGAPMQLLGDRFEQPELGQRAERTFRRSGTEDLVVLLQESRGRALSDFVTVVADGVE